MPAHAACDAMGEIRAIDDNESTGGLGDDSVGSLSNSAQDCRQAPRNGAQSDNGEVLDRERTHNPRSRHGSSANAGKIQFVRGTLPKCADQGSTQRVAGFFAGNDVDGRWPRHRGSHRAPPSDTPTMKMPARSAAAIVSAASAMMVLPALTA